MSSRGLELDLKAYYSKVSSLVAAAGRVSDAGNRPHLGHTSCLAETHIADLLDMPLINDRLLEWADAKRNAQGPCNPCLESIQEPC